MEAGRVYILSKMGHVFCLDAKSGAVVWQKHLTNDYGVKPHEWGFSGSPILVDDLIVLNAGTHGLALRKQDGSLAWVNEKGPSGYSSAVPYEQQGKKMRRDSRQSGGLRGRGGDGAGPVEAALEDDVRREHSGCDPRG